jgi:hypothetical protein
MAKIFGSITGAALLAAASAYAQSATPIEGNPSPARPAQAAPGTTTGAGSPTYTSPGADHYHEALHELVKAKQAHRKPRMPKSAKPTAKVVNFMDALKKSLHSRAHATPTAHRRRRSA